MGFNPWVSEQLMAQRSADLQRAAERQRVVHELRVARRPSQYSPSSSPGPVALRAARMLVALGWRLAGPDALPVHLDGHLVPGAHA